MTITWELRHKVKQSNNTVHQQTSFVIKRHINALEAAETIHVTLDKSISLSPLLHQHGRRRRRRHRRPTEKIKEAEK